MEKYRIIKKKNYAGFEILVLQYSENKNWYHWQNVDLKRYEKFILRGLDPLNGTHIENYLKYNNL